MAGKTDKLESKKCLTHEFRVSYPAVFEARSYEENDPEFGVTMLFDKDVDLSKPALGTKNSLKGVIVSALKEKWGEKDKWPKNRRSPIRDGAEKSDEPGYEDCFFVKARSKENRKPLIAGPNGKELKDPTAIYAGCYARAWVIAYTYDRAGNKGVGFTLVAIQKTRDGEPLETMQDVSKLFSAVDGAEDDDTDTDASDDDYDI